MNHMHIMTKGQRELFRENERPIGIWPDDPGMRIQSASLHSLSLGMEDEKTLCRALSWQMQDL